MKAILGHIGTWAPMAEQKAVARFLPQRVEIEKYLEHFKKGIEERLQQIFEGIQSLKKEGLPIDAIAPEAAIYLTLKIDAAGKTTVTGKKLETQAAVTAFILNEAHIAIVPFYAFGSKKDNPWYRLSVGTCKKEEIPDMLRSLKNALLQITG